jgi:HSP20 family protein
LSGIFIVAKMILNTEVNMSNITKRVPEGNRSLMRDYWNVDNLFDTNWMSRFENIFPAVNISESEKMYNIELMVPGFKKEDLKIKLDDDILTISAESKTESTENNKKDYTRRDYSYNAFTRSFTLPDNVKADNIDANYADGVLRLTLPKSETQVRKHKEVSIK